jgi:DnaA family protein
LNVLYTARGIPDDIGLDLPDLRSRLQQCLRVMLDPLDEAGRRDVLRERAQRRGLVLEDAALEWLLTRTDRDLGALVALLDRLDRASLAAQRRITVPFLRSVL